MLMTAKAPPPKFKMNHDGRKIINIQVRDVGEVMLKHAFFLTEPHNMEHCIHDSSHFFSAILRSDPSQDPLLSQWECL
jgi:hypothetical protein